MHPVDHLVPTCTAANFIAAVNSILDCTVIDLEVSGVGEVVNCYCLG